MQNENTPDTVTVLELPLMVSTSDDTTRAVSTATSPFPFPLSVSRFTSCIGQIKADQWITVTATVSQILSGYGCQSFSFRRMCGGSAVSSPAVFFSISLSCSDDGSHSNSPKWSEIILAARFFRSSPTSMPSAMHRSTTDASAGNAKKGISGMQVSFDA